ncbi:MAG TPA: rRNA maturation RNase YbeY [Bacillota bacterium]
MPTLLNNIQSQQELTEAQLALVTAVLDFGLASFDRSEAEVSLVLVDNDYIQELNLEYRGVDQPTDVLSFALEEADEAPELHSEEELPKLLGDIYISVERAREQAESYGHSLERELAYLATHGLLHLLGYDHQTSETKQVMRQAEERIMQEFMLSRT